MSRGADPASVRGFADEMVELLTPVVAGSTEFPEAIRLLVQARMMRNDPAAELIPVIEQARALEPQNREFDFLLAHLYEREQRWDDAEGVLQEAAARATTPEQLRRAEALLDNLRTRRSLMAAQRLEPSPEPRSEPEGFEPQPVRARQPVEPQPAAPPAAPPEVRYVRGTLVDVKCQDDSAVVTVKLERKAGEPTRVLHLAVRSRAQLIVIDPTDSGQALGCGPAETTVAVNYRVEAAGEALAGVVMTLEFNPPKPLR